MASYSSLPELAKEESQRLRSLWQEELEQRRLASPWQPQTASHAYSSAPWSRARGAVLTGYASMPPAAARAAEAAAAAARAAATAKHAAARAAAEKVGPVSPRFKVRPILKRRAAAPCNHLTFVTIAHRR